MTVAQIFGVWREMKEKTEFLIGCNYWASNAGCFMWKRFDENVVRKDLAYLADYGVNCIRVFPTWDDFQPIMENPIPHSPHFDKYSFRTRVNDRVMLDADFPESGLSREKVEQFKRMLDIAKDYDIKVIVSFITGWMSGRRFIPEALRGKDVLADPAAIVWECRFIRDMISQIKHYDNIIAWEPGNECNCLSYEVNKEQSELWLMAITNAIRLADPTRPVYSGMYDVDLQSGFNQRMVSRYADMLTTHPYPSFVPYCSTEDVLQMRASLHAACENAYYASITGKPCMVEEINVLGPCTLSDDYAPKYFEQSLMTSLATGTTGYLWRCAFEQDKLDFPPYDCNQLERNLGLAYSDYKAKPVLEKLKEMSFVVAELGVLPAPKADAVCILTFCVDQWKIAYGSFVMGVQAGRQIDFVYEEDAIPENDHYILPGVQVANAIPTLQLNRVVERVEKGAKLLITYNGGGFGNFERLTGLKIAGRAEAPTEKIFALNGKTMTIPCPVRLKLVPHTANVLLCDEDGDILLSENKVGNGKVLFFNAPLEDFYTETYMAENTPACEVYKSFFADKEKVFEVECNRCMVTLHEIGDGKFDVLVNSYNEDKTLAFRLQNGYNIVNVKYGALDGDKLILDSTYAYLELERK